MCCFMFARKIVSFKLSDRINTKLAIDTVNIALSTTVCHTDSCFILTGGSQFTSEKFRKHLDSLNIVQSFSAKGGVVYARLIFLLSALLTSVQSVFISVAETPASRLKQRIIEIICIAFDFLSCTYLLNLMCFAIPGIFIFSAFPGHNGYSPKHAKIYHADIVPLSSSPGKPSSS